MKVYSIISFGALLILYNCSTPRLVQTKWNSPIGAKIRIFNYNTNIIEHHIPAEIELSLTSKSYPYYVEIITSDHKRLYGILKIIAATEFTDLSAIKLNISPEIIKNATNNQSSQITITDPAAGFTILTLRIGNRIPPKMKKLYKKHKITPY